MDVLDQARRVLVDNDMGGYTVPTRGLYPFQWNWDSAFTALGFASFDRDRAWQELETLMAAQWDSGLVPHIVFWEPDADYYPGPAIWRSNTDPATSCITQPPVVASVARWLLADGDASDRQRAVCLLPFLAAYHDWFAAERLVDGVIATIHPWETGRDNCPDWDIGMAGVEVPEQAGSYQRTDLKHVDADQRPTSQEYDRFTALVAFGAKHGWQRADGVDPLRRPFAMGDPGLQFIFTRASRDLAELAAELGDEQIAARAQEIHAQALAGCQSLWNKDQDCYCSKDLLTGKFTDGIASAAMLAWYAGAGEASQRASLLDHMREQLALVRYGMPSWDPRDERFEPRRYWRGPVWAVVNYMIARGLAEQGESDLAARLDADTCQLIDAAGFCEYFDPLAGTGAGGDHFTWTAAIRLALARQQQ